MISTLEKVTRGLATVRLGYVVGDESLLGLSEGNLDKYLFNPVLYQFPVRFSWTRYLVLALILMMQGIIVKPKWIYGHIRLKIRAKTGLFTKATNYIYLLPLAENGEAFEIVETGRTCAFPKPALFPTNQLNYEGLKLSTPHDLDQFVKVYRNELLSNSYRTHPATFDAESARLAESMLFDIAGVLNRLSAHWWLEGGTLLGIHRDGKLLDWDHDIDLGLRFDSEEQISQLLKALKKTRYYIKTLVFPQKSGVWNPGNFRLIKIFPRHFYFFHTNLCLDLFIFYKAPLENSGALVYKYVVHERNGYHPASMLDELQNIEFQGHQLNLPLNADSFLESKYGSGWRTPIKEWHVAIDDKTILSNMDSN
ncbi:MAG: LicD family protein [Candidatus Marinimicrobia bacterium]|nr:LicD family protein [Candidatus Neomarinimicrobiota bacterium]